MKARVAAMLLATCALLAPTRTARAAAGPPADTPPSPLLALDLKRCVSVPAPDVRDTVGVELRRSVAVALAADSAEGVSPSSPAAGATTAVRVACAELKAEIEIVDPLTGKTVTRMVDLNATAPVARARLLALAIVELLSASWMELESAPQAGAPAVDVVAAPEARAQALEFVRGRPAAEQRPRRIMATLGAVGSPGSDGGPRRWGGGLSVGGDGAHHLGWVADLSIAHGSRQFSLGVVTVETVSGLVAMVAHASRGRATVRGGAGARGGGAWLSGAPADPDTAGGAVRGLWWGPVLLADGTFVLGRRIVVGLTLEAGRTIAPVTARVQGASPVVVGGTWFKAALGVGLAF